MTMKLFFVLALVNLVILLSGCESPSEKIPNNAEFVRVAFMPDIHFHDIYGEFTDGSFKGLPTHTEQGVQHASIRSMRAQLHSTRLFNENYFALLAALDDIVKREIKYVALPGDFSDDGQPLHLRGLKTILDKYQREHGIEFFMAPGNHDPTRPVSHPAGKMDFLGQDGKEQPIFSLQHPLCAEKNSQQTNAVICSDEVQELGYQPIMNLFSEQGFFPRSHYVYYETPYSKLVGLTAAPKNSVYGDATYHHAVAREAAQFDKRQYEICHQGAGGKYKQPHYSDCYWVADTSYLVEPTPGLWLLAIDANVYQPKLGGNGNALDADNFLGSSDAGYNKVITHKPHLLEWIRDLVQRAQAQGKTLIAFSHFPMSEFYDGAAEDIAHLMGDGKFQLNRNPSAHTSKLLADTGLKVHVAGHMHINDTGVYRSENGKVLFNIQAPSLAAYVPAYKVLTIKTAQQVEVETVVLNDVPRFDELFAHYRTEWDYLQRMNAADIWDKNILQAKNYRQFTQWHLRELARLRFLPQEWPADLRELLLSLNGEQLLVMSQLNADVTLEQIAALIGNTNQDRMLEQKWQQASQQAANMAHRQGLTTKSFAAWNGLDMGVDFYRLWNADQLALKDIDAQRFAHYRLLAQAFLSPVEESSLRARYQTRLAQLLHILVQFAGDAPSDHFLLELDRGQIQALP
ncbi:Calcineurin-like phosphoesterase [Cellvibrio sp. BR]|nr:Calcineurin-like phosphoesterase [Cellvibrio sp. BR]